MLDLAVRNLTFRYPGTFELRIGELLFPRSTHSAIVGPHPCGATTLLRLIGGELRPSGGDVIIGARAVTELKASRRPVLSVTSKLDVPGWWSVRHALVAAVRTRSLDRIDREREYKLTLEQWAVHPDRRISTLSATERARVHFARIELLRPAILVADRLLEQAPALAEQLYRRLRILGTTVISAPASHAELAMTDQVVVMAKGQVLQSGSAAEVFAHPVSEEAAIGTGGTNVVPIAIRGNVVESVIGSWELADPPFQGNGVALCRPADFAIAKGGEDSDFVFGIEEAGFAEGQWLARGLLTGGVELRVVLPYGANVHKGRLLALRYDPSRFTLLPRERDELQPTVPTDVVPPLRESR